MYIFKTKAPWIIEDTRPPSDWPSEGNVDFVNYSVKYREELDFVLKDINININPTEKVFNQTKFIIIMCKY